MKKSIGLYLTALSAVAGVAGAIAYGINTGTKYFINLGVNPTVMGCIVVAIVCQVAYLVLSRKGHKPFSDVLAVLPPVLLIVAVVTLLSIRVNGFAAIMTFENNPQNMADLTSAIVAIAACLVATLVGVLASFFDVVKKA